MRDVTGRRWHLHLYFKTDIPSSVTSNTAANTDMYNRRIRANGSRKLLFQPLKTVLCITPHSPILTEFYWEFCAYRWNAQKSSQSFCWVISLKCQRSIKWPEWHYQRSRRIRYQGENEAVQNPIINLKSLLPRSKSSARTLQLCCTFLTDSLYLHYSPSCSIIMLYSQGKMMEVYMISNFARSGRSDRQQFLHTGNFQCRNGTYIGQFK